MRAPADNFQVSVTVVDAATGQPVAASYKRHPGGYPTSRWPLSRYVRDVHRFQLPPDLAPGTYLIQVALWECAADLPDCRADQQLAFFDEMGNPMGGSLVLPVLLTAGG